MLPRVLEPDYAVRRDTPDDNQLFDTGALQRDVCKVACNRSFGYVDESNTGSLMILRGCKRRLRVEDKDGAVAF